MEAVETEKVEASKDVKALMKHVRKCFETEDIYVDQQQLTDYLGLARYFPYDEVFPWQQFVIGLHDCTYWWENGRPRWPDLFCLIGRGAGKDGTIALESTALASEYNGIREYDVDICANNEDQALRPVQDIVGAFEQPKWLKKLQRFFKWTREKVVCKSTSEIPIEDLEMFENIAYIMAQHADPENVPPDIMDWLEQFNTFSIYQILPAILELWNMNEETKSQAKKNLDRVAGS